MKKGTKHKPHTSYVRKSPTNLPPGLFAVIKGEYEKGTPAQRIEKLYGVARQTVSRLAKKLEWTRLTTE